MRHFAIFALVAAVRTIGGQSAPAVAVSTADVDLFFKAYATLANARTADDSADVLWREYYLQGSRGLRSFIQLRIGSPFDLLAQIRSRPAYYAHLTSSLRGLPQAVSSLHGVLARFQAIYPPVRFAPVYFVVGRMNSGGTVSSNALLIGAEMYGRDAAAPVHELSEWERSVLKDTSLVATITLHELIHINQPPNRNTTLLSAAIREGSADFLAELATGRNINAHVHEWALPREAELWAEFSAVMDGSSNGDWFGGQRRTGRPADLGYFMGYRIAKAYYDTAANKTAAIGAILALADPKALLAESGYAERFRR